MTAQRNEIETARLKLSTTKPVVEDLKRLVATGYFGKNPAEAAERILSDRLLVMKKEDPKMFSGRVAAPKAPAK